MKMRDLLDPTTLRALYLQRDIEGEQMRPKMLQLQGPPGIGKTDVVREFPGILTPLFKEMFGYFEFVVPEHESQDMRGFMIPTKNKAGTPISVYAYPPVMPSQEYFDAHPHGIAFVDEVNQGDMSMNKALSAFMLEGRMGDVRMPKGWWVIGASNRMADRSGVVRAPMHNINRQRIINIEADKESLIAWQTKHQMHPLGVAFTEAQPGIVISDSVPSEAKPFCTPRSFASAMMFLRELAGVNEHGHINMDIPTSIVAQEAVAGDVGEGASAQMFAFFKVVDQMPTFEQILKDPKKAKVPTFERLDAAYATMMMCVFNCTPANVDTVWQYAERLPMALQVPAARSLLEKGSGALLNSKALGKWIQEHQALIYNTLR